MAAASHSMVGMASVHLYRDRFCNGEIQPLAYVDDVVVDPAHQGKGIARQLMINLIRKAQEWGAVAVDLTSAPHRHAANHLYISMGFKLLDASIMRREPVSKLERDEIAHFAPLLGPLKEIRRDVHCVQTLVGRKMFVDHSVSHEKYLCCGGPTNAFSRFLAKLNLLALLSGAGQINVALVSCLNNVFAPYGYQPQQTNAYRLNCRWISTHPTQARGVFFIHSRCQVVYKLLL